MSLIPLNCLDKMKGLWFMLVLVAVAKSERIFTGDQVIRVDVQSEEQIKLLQFLESEEKLNLDFWLHPVSTKLPVDVRVPRTHLSAVKEYLHAHRIPFTVMIDNVQELLDQEKAEMEENHISERSTRSFNFGAYHPLDTIYSWMDTLVAQHPNLVTKLDMGRSYENRPLYVLKFSTGGTKRPAIWIDLGIHSREWVSQATGVWTANKIATDYGTDASLTSLLNTMDIYMLIVANPDGYVFTHTSDRMWRKTRSKNSGSVCVGVDPNRNWDAGFGGPGASSLPCSDSYHGPSAHSEIEVKNIVSLIQSHGNFKSFISVHAYSQLLMYPYGYTCRGAPDQAELDSVARAAVQKLTSLYGTAYQVGNICNIIYQASGGSIDWSYDEGIKYSFAFELRDTGRYGFILPADQIIPTASETWLALKHIMEYVRDHPY
ncbi:carbamoyl-phosphate synthase (glutamine-hydrolyzing) cpa2 [Ataeniobius toweri]|uniref:Carbamoyl-phosphate synthase (Glutamine-hydrolyzing) cpa2 n=1 Tax=Ataeniobius toweri TaxID=208326 RepID=A0ABU7BDP9_9TELE|nr:carbamoyl-phosphate synthase (glutamine-hydrolyzing) cpa2 [Ataeniobius toweri]